MRRFWWIGLAGLALAGALLVGSCSSSKGPAFAIVSGSENQPLEPIVQEYCKRESATCTVTATATTSTPSAIVRPCRRS